MNQAGVVKNIQGIEHYSDLFHSFILLPLSPM